MNAAQHPQLPAKLSPRAEREIWKRMDRGDQFTELREIALRDGLSPIDADRIIGEMQMAYHLVGKARTEPWQVRLGLYVGIVAMIMGGAMLWYSFSTGAVSSRVSGRYNPTGYAIWALVLGIILTVRGWRARR